MRQCGRHRRKMFLAKPFPSWLYDASNPTHGVNIKYFSGKDGWRSSQNSMGSLAITSSQPNTSSAPLSDFSNTMVKYSSLMFPVVTGISNLATSRVESCFNPQVSIAELIAMVHLSSASTQYKVYLPAGILRF